ncbi:hypothetical protein HSBGL_2111 [Halapricum desulfuricans]|uniref:Uncharacterized protein n=1 Tax=Halapricum desulfuricans TaxID=2841257 RepID=A0A897NNU9_9EURY|nr:hypothetical protein [Halapricum desulfuricans]QSG12519.1 hypothetical protein HSBGL_2111 [Halapricum desulfuricans]
MGYTDVVLSTAARVAAFVLAFASGAFGTTVLGVFLVGFGVGGDLRFAVVTSAVAGAVAAAGVLVVTRR